MPDKKSPPSRLQALLQRLAGDDSEPTLTDQEIETVFNTADPKGLSIKAGELGTITAPVPGHPYPYGKQLNIHDPAINKAAAEVMRQFPGLQDRIKEITTTPTRAVLQDLNRAGIDPVEARDTNLLGSFDRRSREMYVDPEEPDQTTQTVAHELAHAMNYGEGTAYALGRSILKYLRGNKIVGQ